nr:MAG TPA: hypothetical protein [Caudoviricetes sp.]
MFYYPSNLGGELAINCPRNSLMGCANLKKNDIIILHCNHKLSDEEYERVHKPMCASIDDNALFILKPVDYYSGEGVTLVDYKVTTIYYDLDGILDMYNNEFTQNILFLRSIGFTDAIEAGEVYTMLKNNVPNFDIEEEDDLGDDSDIDFIIHG